LPWRSRKPVSHDPGEGRSACAFAGIAISRENNSPIAKITGPCAYCGDDRRKKDFEDGDATKPASISASTGFSRHDIVLSTRDQVGNQATIAIVGTQFSRAFYIGASIATGIARSNSTAWSVRRQV
jgi:hypothetical protein